MGLLAGVALAALFGLVHFGLHRLRGEERYFDKAGVAEAGAGVVVLGFLVGLVLV